MATKKKTETIVKSVETTADDTPAQKRAKKTKSLQEKEVNETSTKKKTTSSNKTKKTENEKPSPRTRKPRTIAPQIPVEERSFVVEEEKKEDTLMTPSDYFHKIKGMMGENSAENVRNLISNAMSLMKKPLITGQTKMAEDIYTVSQVLLKELNAVEKGFTTYVKRDDLLYYIDKVANKVAKIIDIQNYEREIPDDVFEKLLEAKDVFDEFLIVFTDYTGESERKIEKKKRDKDPILFGVFKMNEPNEKTVYFGRLYFIGDWVDEYCDLTLDKMIEEYKNDTGKVITNVIHPKMSVEDIRSAIDTLKNGNKGQALPKEDGYDEL